MSNNAPQNFGIPVFGIANLTAAGTTQLTAFQLTSQQSAFSSVAAGSGAILPVPGGGPVSVYNQGANALLLYPGLGDQIFGFAVNAPIILLPGSGATLVCFDNPLTTAPRIWRLVSSSGGEGSASLSASAVVSNATGALGSLPPGAYILRLLMRETAGHSVNVTVGTTSGASDVAPTIAAGTLTVPANGTLLVDVGSFLKSWFSSTATQAIWLASASWGSASVNAQLDYEVGP